MRLTSKFEDTRQIHPFGLHLAACVFITDMVFAKCWTQTIDKQKPREFQHSRGFFIFDIQLFESSESRFIPTKHGGEIPGVPGFRGSGASGGLT